MNKKIIYLILPAIIFGISVAFNKYALNMGINPVSLVSSSSVFVLIFSAVYFFTKIKTVNKVYKKQWPNILTVWETIKGITI